MALGRKRSGDDDDDQDQQSPQPSKQGEKNPDDSGKGPDKQGNS